MTEWPEALKAKTIQIIWIKDLDDFIEAHLGRPWSTGQNTEGAGQETLIYFEVGPDPEATAVVEAWLASEPAGCPGRLDQPGYAESVTIYTDQILQELCNRGFLPEGDMTVHVWW